MCEVHAQARGCRGEDLMMVQGSWDAGVSDGVSHFMLELAEKLRSDFEKINFRNFTDPVEKMTRDEGDVAGKGRRLRLQFYEDQE